MGRIQWTIRLLLRMVSSRESVHDFVSHAVHTILVSGIVSGLLWHTLDFDEYDAEPVDNFYCAGHCCG